MPRPLLPRSSRAEFVRQLGGLIAVTLAGPHLRGEPTERRWKAAVIGHTGRGDYGHGLERIFARLPGVELVALADPDPAGRARVGPAIGAPRLYADPREMLDRERPDLVSLAMRHADQHHALGLAALRAGAHLYCEKPFVTCPAEADELLAEAERRQRRIAVAHTMRLMPAVVALHRWVAEGGLGELVEIRAHGKQDARAGGEDLMVLGTHLFDLMRLFGGDPIACSARVLQGNRNITTADARRVRDDVGWVAGDRVFASFAFPRGVQATFTSVGALRETAGPWGIELRGSQGAARILCDLVPTALIRRGGPANVSEPLERWEKLDPGTPVAAADHNAAPVADWLRAIQDRREPECSGRNGAWAVEMVAAVYRSALAGTEVRFPLAQRGHPLAPAGTSKGG